MRWWWSKMATWQPMKQHQWSQLVIRMKWKRKIMVESERRWWQTEDDGKCTTMANKTPPFFSAGAITFSLLWMTLNSVFEKARLGYSHSISIQERSKWMARTLFSTSNSLLSSLLDAFVQTTPSTFTNHHCSIVPAPDTFVFLILPLAQ